MCGWQSTPVVSNGNTSKHITATVLLEEHPGNRIARSAFNPKGTILYDSAIRTHHLQTLALKTGSTSRGTQLFHVATFADKLDLPR